ncbi:O-fucosyltransferase 6 [Triticum aestivum]|uniref:O-fucosyltransferase 6 n=1 Tax=Triticum aestivum TaxID=4565 RepID=UPI001D012654|nr:O-fucosyltransferase 6-like [Triticum aestivum]
MCASSQIIDVVVAARILNATLVVPKLDQTSFWKAAGFFNDFAEIFNADWFISFLSKDVRIVNGLPKIGGCYSSDRAKVLQDGYCTRDLPQHRFPISGGSFGFLHGC